CRVTCESRDASTRRSGPTPAVSQRRPQCFVEGREIRPCPKLLNADGLRRHSTAYASLLGLLERAGRCRRRPRGLNVCAVSGVHMRHLRAVASHTPLRAAITIVVNHDGTPETKRAARAVRTALTVGGKVYVVGK